MAYPDGFTYISGPYEIRRMNILSTATFLARNPVSIDGSRRVIEATAINNTIFGVAQNDAASSIYGAEILVLVPNEQTVFATKVQTGTAASALSAGFAYALEKAGNYLRVDVDSQATAKVQIVPRGDGTTINSADSSVYVQFLQASLAPFASTTSVTVL